MKFCERNRHMGRPITIRMTQAVQWTDSNPTESLFHQMRLDQLPRLSTAKHRPLLNILLHPRSVFDPFLFHILPGIYQIKRLMKNLLLHSKLEILNTEAIYVHHACEPMPHPQLLVGVALNVGMRLGSGCGINSSTACRENEAG